MSERSAREPGSPRPTSETGSAGDGRPAPAAAHAAPDGKTQGGTQDLAQSLRAAATRATQAASAAAARVTSSGATTRTSATGSRDAGQSAFGARPRLPLPPPPEAPLPRRAASTSSATGPTVPTPAPTPTVPTRAPEATVPNPPSSPTAPAPAAPAPAAASADGRADVDDDRRWATAAPQDRSTAAAPTGNPNFARPQDSLVDGARPVAAMSPMSPAPAAAATPLAPAPPAAAPAGGPSPRPAEEVHSGTGGTAAAAAGLAGGGVAGGAAATQLAPPPVRPSSPSTGAERTADPAARTASPVEAARAAGTGQPTRATTAPGPAAQRHPARIRKARLRLLRVDPWSVMKTAFLLSIAAGAMLVVAIGVLWSVLDAAGVFSQVGNVVRDVTSSESSPGFSVEEYLGFSRVMGFSTLIAVIDIVLVTALATLGAFLYNLSASLLGGLEVTLAEDD